MSSSTTNIGLTKPAMTDTWGNIIPGIASSMDTIDNRLGILSALVYPVGQRQSGETDDAPRIQRAINSAAATGGLVHFGFGQTYQLASTVLYKSNIIYYGINTTINFSGTPIAFDKNDSTVNNVIFDGLNFTRGDSVPDTLTNNSGVNNGTIALKGYFSTITNNVIVRNCNFHDIAGRGIFLKGINHLVIEKNLFTNLYDAIEIGSTGDSTNYNTMGIKNQDVSRNIFYNCSTGIVVQGLSNVTIGSYVPAGLIEYVKCNDNILQRVCGLLIEFYAYVNKGEMKNNIAKDCSNSSGTGALTSKCSKNVEIIGNTVPYILVQGNTTDPGGYDFSMKNVKITDNIIDAEFQSNPNATGIYIWRQATNVEIEDNLITNGLYGINLGMTSSEQTSYPTESQTSIKVKRNTVHDNDTYGLQVQQIDRVEMDENYIFNNGHTTDNNGMGIRFNLPVTNSLIRRNKIEDTNSGANIKQAVGIYLHGNATASGTTFLDNTCLNNKNSNIYNPNGLAMAKSVPYHISGTTSATIGTQTSLAHGLGFIPSMVSITPNGNGVVYQSANPDITNIYVKGSAASLNYDVYIWQ